MLGHMACLSDMVHLNSIYMLNVTGITIPLMELHAKCGLKWFKDVYTSASFESTIVHGVIPLTLSLCVR